VRWIARLKGGPLTALILLLVYQRPVHRKAIMQQMQWDKTTARKYLATLEQERLAVQVEDVWQLPQAGYQLALTLVAVDAPDQGAGEIAPAFTGELSRRGEISSPSIISVESSDSIESLNKTTNTGGRKFLAPPKGRHSSGGQHIAAVLASLARKGAPAPADDDPFPADLRQCIEQLVHLGAPRRKAELAVAASPFDSATLAGEIVAWQRHYQSPAGRGIKADGFPFLVCRRLADGERCPTQLAAVDPYGGYLSND
jgi:hypothetical protein